MKCVGVVVVKAGMSKIAAVAADSECRVEFQEAVGAACAGPAAGESDS
jgi:hypothetical protein